MQLTDSQSSFFIRTINPSRSAAYQPSKPLLVVEPQKIEIMNYLSDSITNVRMTIKNQSKIPKKFSVVPPNKSYFFIKCPEKSIRGRDSIQLFVQFNPQREKNIIQDQLIIKVEGDYPEFHIPIFCYPKSTIGSRPESRNTLSKRDSQEGNNDIISRRASQKPKRFTKRSSIMVTGADTLRKVFQNDPYLYTYASFQERFRQISDYVRQKLVKNEVYLGAKTLTSQKQLQIQQHKLKTTHNENQRLMKQVTNRFIIQYANEGPIVSNDVEVNLSWNLQRNIPSITFNLGVQKLQEEVKKYVISLRFERIHNSLKIYEEYKKKAENQARKVKIQDYVQFLQNRLKQNFVASDYDFQFDSISIQPTMLPIQPQFRSTQTTFQISQRVGFDNWVPMNILKPNFQEIYSQQEIEFPAFYYHHPIVINDYKKGGLQQMPFKQINQFTVQQIDPLLEVPMEERKENFEELTALLQRKQNFFFQTEIYEEEDSLEEQQLMNFGPLNPLRWNKKPTASIDMYNSIKY